MGEKEEKQQKKRSLEKEIGKKSMEERKKTELRKKKAKKTLIKLFFWNIIHTRN